MSPDSNGLVPVPRAPEYAATTWGPYYDTLHPPGTVHWMAKLKGVSRWMDAAARLWRQRQALRAEYAARHGTDPARWPTRHPRITLDGVDACLGCHWLSPVDTLTTRPPNEDDE